ncbi:MAG: polyprenyl synthetase family protein [Deltaproteobacteria bacterium]|nr:polyprenyl synthetase family protein [Deltaproteobacteria bacterium]
MREESKFLDQFASYFGRINEELDKILDSKVSLIEEVGSHSLLGEGKRLRPLFFILSCQLCNYYESDVYPLSTVFECLHAASLLHDDVLDNASIRRGRSSANKIWGNSTAVLVGDFLFSKSSRIAVEKRHIEFLRVIADTAIRMTEGQMLELVNTHNWNITRREYMGIITSKTADLLSAACASGGIVAGANEADIQSLKNFGLNMGIAFQIVDDVFDYTSTVEKSGKPTGNDLREGKITLPLIYTIAYLEEEERDRMEDMFKNGKASEKDYLRIIEFVQDNGAINKCRKDAQDYASRAETYLSLFPDSPIKESLLKLNQYLVNRSY